VDPITLFGAATTQAAAVINAVTNEQLGDATPCSEWTVQQLIDHMIGGPDYLAAAAAGIAPAPRSGSSAGDYVSAVSVALNGLRQPGALDLVCMSPLGFEWPLVQAAAGTFMDTLIHTWDLATATGQPSTLDSGLVDACIALFLPDMPEQGRAGGLIGPAVEVPADAGPQARLLGALGRRP
jgi:uncharacterized protein (TIGR03086 family)